MASYHSIQKYLNRIPGKIREAIEQTQCKVYINGSFFIHPSGKFMIHLTNKQDGRIITRYCRLDFCRDAYSNTEDGWYDSKRQRVLGQISSSVVSEDEKEFLQSIDLFNKRIALCHDASGWSMIHDRDTCEGPDDALIRTVKPTNRDHAQRIMQQAWNAVAEGYKLDSFSLAPAMAFIIEAVAGGNGEIDTYVMDRFLRGIPTYVEAVLSIAFEPKIKAMREQHQRELWALGEKLDAKSGGTATTSTSETITIQALGCDWDIPIRPLRGLHG